MNQPINNNNQDDKNNGNKINCWKKTLELLLNMETLEQHFVIKIRVYGRQQIVKTRR
jgi:hypothetical protein